MNQEAANKLVEHLIRHLGEVSEGSRLIFKAGGTIDNFATSCHIYKSDADGDPEGRVSYVPVAHHIDELAEELREACYQEGDGTWYGMAITLDSGNARVELFDNHEPDVFGLDLTADDLIDDLEVYVRDEDKLPLWLLEKFKDDTLAL